MWGYLAAVATGAALGAMKNQSDREKFEKGKHRQKTTAVYNHWTGMVAPEPTQPNPVWADMLAGGLTGMQMAQNLQGLNEGEPKTRSAKQGQAASSDLLDSYLETSSRNKRMAKNPWTLFPPGVDHG